jgi:tetratricopeptide (TPR) repeat protein
MPATPPRDTAARPVLTPPGDSARQDHPEAGRYLWLWIALLIVLVLGLAVIFALPALVPSPQAVDPVAAEPDAMPEGEPRDRANQAMQAYLQLRAQLQLGQASLWGEPEWSESQRYADSAAQLLAQRQFEDAARGYRQALHSLQRLESERGIRLDTALARGQQALAENRVTEAITQFEHVLAIDADNEDARFGLARSQTRPAVLENMANAERTEAEGDLQAAQAYYQQAALLDPEYAPPAAAFQRVTEALQALAFQDAMTRALTALDNGRLREADKALAEAGTLRPSDAAVTDARQRLSQARLQSRMGSLRRQAATLVRAENWQAAGNVYKRVLAIDATAGFARSGLEKANARLAVNRQFDHYLQQPERLFDTQPLANAETLLATIDSAPADEPKLAKKIADLQRLVTLAGTPVTVSLLSDGRTDISIYHVGQLGVFTRQQLELLPGTYTVVGSRAGYRDIRKQLSVLPGKQGTSLTIRCEEMI